MKTSVMNAAVFLIVICAAFHLAGCASMDSQNQTSLLSAAGFRVRTPKTPQQQEAYTALPAYKVERANIEDKVVYIYKDEKHGIAYVGGEPEYERYQQLAIQKKIASDNYQAAQLNHDITTSWNGAWGYGPY